MDKVDITFKHEGRSYNGCFCKVSGSGNSGVWHLMIDKYYYGQLFLTQHFGWKFYGTQFNELSEYFGDYVEAYCK